MASINRVSTKGTRHRSVDTLTTMGTAPWVRIAILPMVMQSFETVMILCQMPKRTMLASECPLETTKTIITTIWEVITWDRATIEVACI